MKTLEIRRHSMRNPPGENLTQAGVTLARTLGNLMGKFDRVVTSPVPRAFQTAIAMGYAVDEDVKMLASMGDAVDAECPWPASFADYSAANVEGSAVQHYVRRLNKFYTSLVAELREGSAALVINHGGVVELSAVACMPKAVLTDLGEAVKCCEGIRLTWEQGNFTQIEVLRL